MLQQAARRAAAALFGRSKTLEAAVPAVTRSLATAPPQREEDDDSFELLPPGCSLKDPTYGRSFGANRNSLSDPVVIYDNKPVEEYRPLKKQQPVPPPPLNVAAAQAKLQESKDAKKKAAVEAGQEEDDDLYVYLPPGSSMRDPVSLPNSMSDPLERRVFYRDPKPTLRKS